MQNSYKLAWTRRNVAGMSCGSRTHIPELVQVSYKLVEVIYIAMNIVDMSCGTRRTVLTKTFVTQLVDIGGDMWRVMIHANSSHIMDKVMNV